MPRVLKHVLGGVEIYVLTRNEHPPPHVHIEHPAEGWEIKVHFSFIENFASTYKVEHVRGKLPSRARLNSLLLEVMNSRRECRASWWQSMGDTGLKNQYVVVLNGVASSAVPIVPNAFLVTTAVYVPATDQITLNGKVLAQCP